MIDCTNIDNLINEMNRMCKQFKNCDGCPIDELRIHGTTCFRAARHNYVDVKNAVQNWSDKNPQKTILDDFKEKYPNAQMQDYGYPKSCCEYLGYGKFEGCIDAISENPCKDCWNRPYGGEQK